MKNNNTVKGCVMAGIFAALTFLATYMLHIPTTNGGYIHIGDTIIYLAASLMPTPFAAPAAAIGGALSDALSPGSAAWIIPTAIIKPLMTLFFTAKSERIICKRNVAAIFIAAVVSLTGYALASGIIYGNFIAPLFQLPLDAVQPIASGILFVIIGTAFDKMKIKDRFDFSFKAKKAN